MQGNVFLFIAAVDNNTFLKFSLYQDKASGFNTCLTIDVHSSTWGL